jgi:hypothetical protein
MDYVLHEPPHVIECARKEEAEADKKMEHYINSKLLK